MFFIKERKRTLRSFWFLKSYKNDRISQKKERKRTVHSFLIIKKNLTLFFAIYIYIYIYLYISIYFYISVYIYIQYIYIYLYIYIEKKKAKFCVLLHSFAFFCKRMKHSRVLLCSLQKNETFSEFFHVLCKRMLRSLRSFMFLRKERKRTHRSFGSHKVPKTQKECKRTLRSLKERKRTMCSERKRMRCPTLSKVYQSV